MSQEQLKEQFLRYAENNLNNETILKSIVELLDNITNDICYDYPKESNRLTTANMIIKEVIKNDELGSYLKYYIEVGSDA